MTFAETLERINWGWDFNGKKDLFSRDRREPRKKYCTPREPCVDDAEGTF